MEKLPHILEHAMTWLLGNGVHRVGRSGMGRRQPAWEACYCRLGLSFGDEEEGMGGSGDGRESQGKGEGHDLSRECECALGEDMARGAADVRVVRSDRSMLSSGGERMAPTRLQ